MNTFETATKQIMVLMDMVSKLGLESAKRPWLQVKPDGGATYSIHINRMTKKQCDKITEMTTTYQYGSEAYRCVLNGVRDSAELWIFPKDEENHADKAPKIRVEIEGWLERSNAFRDTDEED